MAVPHTDRHARPRMRGSALSPLVLAQISWAGQQGQGAIPVLRAVAMSRRTGSVAAEAAASAQGWGGPRQLAHYYVKGFTSWTTRSAGTPSANAAAIAVIVASSSVIVVSLRRILMLVVYLCLPLLSFFLLCLRRVGLAVRWTLNPEARCRTSLLSPLRCHGAPAVALGGRRDEGHPRAAA